MTEVHKPYFNTADLRNTFSGLAPSIVAAIAAILVVNFTSPKVNPALRDAGRQATTMVAADSLGILEQIMSKRYHEIDNWSEIDNTNFEWEQPLELQTPQRQFDEWLTY